MNDAILPDCSEMLKRGPPPGTPADRRRSLPFRLDAQRLAAATYGCAASRPPAVRDCRLRKPYGPCTLTGKPSGDAHQLRFVLA